MVDIFFMSNIHVKALIQDMINRVIPYVLNYVTELPSWCVLSDRCRFTQEQFQDRWCTGAVLARSLLMMLQVAPLHALHVHVPSMCP
jgi:hypothetical protein